MKILCVADHIDPLVYSTGIKSRFKDVDLVLGAGDLPLEYYSFIVSSLNKPLLFVYGNHNLKRYQYFKKKIMDPENWEDHIKPKNNTGATYIEDRGYRFNKVLIAGLGGSIRYNDGENQYSEWQMFWRMIHLVPRLLWNRIVHGRWLDVLLTHAPPRGIHDKSDRCHMGFKTFLIFMNWFKPQYLIHGHIHLYDLGEIRRSQYRKTQVVNCYDHILVELNHGNR